MRARMLHNVIVEEWAGQVRIQQEGDDGRLHTVLITAESAALVGLWVQGVGDAANKRMAEEERRRAALPRRPQPEPKPHLLIAGGG